MIEIHVSAGDEVQPEDPLVTLESDKATMDVPAPFAGTVTQLSVGVGDRVSEGSVLLMLESPGENGGSGSDGSEPASAAPEAPPPPPRSTMHRIRVPLTGAPSPAKLPPHPRRRASPTATRRCSYSERGRAATRPHSAPPTSASRRSSSSATTASAASV
ncbi:MAG: biotin/lipoyl-containing protein [Solirubrobacteraceae bacterium]